MEQREGVIRTRAITCVYNSKCICWNLTAQQVNKSHQISVGMAIPLLWGRSGIQNKPQPTQHHRPPRHCSEKKHTPLSSSTHWLRITCNALCKGSFRSRDTLSPRWARQSSIELSGLAGLNTGEVWQSKPVLVKAKDKIKERPKFINGAGAGEIAGS